jgi:oxalate decarboxylase
LTDLSRREFVARSVAAAGGASLARGAGDIPEPERGNEGATILGPRNDPVDRENPDLLAPPPTDAGALPNLKFSFGGAHTRLTDGGWTRQVNAQELPVATTLAGVEMRLKPDAIRELHWHRAAEWALMLAGDARVTAVDAEGRNFIGDVGEGDLWFFPAGMPHSIQALRQGCEFLLVFDDGQFDEFETFLLTDWVSHTPLSVLAKNFSVPERAFARIPPNIEQERYIFPGSAPRPLRSDSVRSPAGTIPEALTYRLYAQKPIEAPGGRVRIVDSTNFPIATTIAAALVEIDPGGMRELHWHPSADEWQYYLAGRARMTVFGAEGTANTFDYQAGDVGYVPFPMGHYIENTGQQPVRFLEMFRAARYADISLDQWLALTPPALVRAHLDLDQRTIAAFTKTKPRVVAGRPPR